MKGITITKKYLIYLITTIHQINFMKPDLVFKSKYITSKDVKEKMIIIRWRRLLQNTCHKQEKDCMWVNNQKSLWSIWYPFILFNMSHKYDCIKSHQEESHSIRWEQCL